jgi:hypothetical protein
VHLSRAYLKRAEAAHGTHPKDCHMLHIPTRQLVSYLFDSKTTHSRWLLAHESSVCFASLYRIITITRLVQTNDISWAKSDVFIWSSVEPSIGIISGCLPTLRPLLSQVLDPWRKLVPSSNKSSSGSKGSRQYPLNTIETISKKRTRKISKRDELDTLQFTQLEDEVDVREDGTVAEGQTLKDRHHSRGWRPEEESGATRTTIRRNESGYGETGGENRGMDDANGDGITMTKKFEWDETRHS